MRDDRSQARVAAMTFDEDGVDGKDEASSYASAQGRFRPAAELARIHEHTPTPITA